jgi:dUTPase
MIGTVKITYLDTVLKNKLHYVADSATLECVACIERTMRVYPGGTVTVPLGFALTLPKDHLAALLVPADWTGRNALVLDVGLIEHQREIEASLRNEGGIEVLIRPYDNVARIVFLPVVKPTLDEVW